MIDVDHKAPYETVCSVRYYKGPDNKELRMYSIDHYDHKYTILETDSGVALTHSPKCWCFERFMAVPMSNGCYSIQLNGLNAND